MTLNQSRCHLKGFQSALPRIVGASIFCSAHVNTRPHVLLFSPEYNSDVCLQLTRESRPNTGTNPSILWSIDLEHTSYPEIGYAVNSNMWKTAHREMLSRGPSPSAMIRMIKISEYSQGLMAPCTSPHENQGLILGSVTS